MGLAAVLFLSTFAHACLQVAGDYTCTVHAWKGRITTHVKVNQDQDKGLTRVGLRGSHYVVDGQTHVAKENAKGTISYRGFCIPNMMVIEVTATSKKDGKAETFAITFDKDSAELFPENPKWERHFHPTCIRH